LRCEQIVKDSYDAFEKVLGFFVGMTEKMPEFESLATTFDTSKMVQDAVEAVYVSIITFWVAAVKHYKKKVLCELQWMPFQMRVEALTVRNFSSPDGIVEQYVQAIR